MKNRKTRTALILLPIIFAIAVALFFLQKSTDPNIGYFQKIAQITIPQEFQLLRSFDNGEYQMALVFSADRSSLISFATSHHFDSAYERSLPGYFTSGPFGTYKPDNSFHSLTYYLSGSRLKNVWSILIDPSSKRCWITVDYPDLQGDAPY